MSLRKTNAFPSVNELLDHDIILLKHYNALFSNALEFIKADVKNTVNPANF